MTPQDLQQGQAAARGGAMLERDLIGLLFVLTFATTGALAWRTQWPYLQQGKLPLAPLDWLLTLVGSGGSPRCSYC